jgi:hypothetical protein
VEFTDQDTAGLEGDTDTGSLAAAPDEEAYLSNEDEAAAVPQAPTTPSQAHEQAHTKPLKAEPMKPANNGKPHRSSKKFNLERVWIIVMAVAALVLILFGLWTFLLREHRGRWSFGHARSRIEYARSPERAPAQAGRALARIGVPAHALRPAPMRPQAQAQPQPQPQPQAQPQPQFAGPLAKRGALPVGQPTPVGQPMRRVTPDVIMRPTRAHQSSEPPELTALLHRMIAGQQHLDQQIASRLSKIDVALNAVRATVSALGGKIEEPIALKSKNRALTSRLAANKKALRWLRYDRNRLREEIANLKKRVRPVFYGWKVIGLTNNTVAVENTHGGVRLLRVGDTLEGARVLSINLVKSLVHTSFGDVRPQE